MHYIVRYGSTRNLGEFSAKGTKQFRRNAEIIIRSDRGVEWGRVLCEATDNTREWLRAEQQPGKILREATPEDHSRADELRTQEKEQFVGCGEMIQERKMQMQLVDVEHLFGGDRLIFYYLAEKRVDFRELVKALAKRYRTRIEMRQIGVRDEAKLLADYGDCGKPVCCNTHLQEMPPVSMKMAKIQKATLDPTKISGRCGRLKCCLRYEYDTYKDHQREMPSVGSTVVTKVGQGRVVGQEILARKLMVEYERSRYVLTDLNDVLTVIKKSDKKKQDKAKSSSGKPPQSEKKSAKPAETTTATEEKPSPPPQAKSEEAAESNPQPQKKPNEDPPTSEGSDSTQES